MTAAAYPAIGSGLRRDVWAATVRPYSRKKFSEAGDALHAGDGGKRAASAGDPCLAGAGDLGLEGGGGEHARGSGEREPAGGGGEFGELLPDGFGARCGGGAIQVGAKASRGGGAITLTGENCAEEVLGLGKLAGGIEPDGFEEGGLGGVELL